MELLPQEKVSEGYKTSQLSHIFSLIGACERGAGNDIPPNSDLLFEMELIEIVERYTEL